MPHLFPFIVANDNGSTFEMWSDEGLARRFAESAAKEQRGHSVYVARLIAVVGFDKGAEESAWVEEETGS